VGISGEQVDLQAITQTFDNSAEAFLDLPVCCERSVDIADEMVELQGSTPRNVDFEHSDYYTGKPSI
jgi:hypothetical protein